MIENVFRPSRLMDGKRQRSRLYVGRYALEPGAKPVRVALNTPDREIALKRLRAIVLEKQREREGIIAPKAVRDAAVAALGVLVADYEADLATRELAEKHVHDTTTRLRRMIREAGWKIVSDIRADSFVQWRTTLRASAKTKKEYQISLSAFLNWLVKTDRLLLNPLAKLDKVVVSGKQVRESRAFSEDEISRLFAVAGKRLLAYQTLLYTGQRKSEVRALVWGDLHLDEAKPYALFREGTMKDAEKRPVPLRPELAAALRQFRPANVDAAKKVFWFHWPTYDLLRGDLKRAGIAHKDGLGRVVHFHSFRKTWQTLGVRYGVNQRSAQEVLGHSDANLTAKVYTDVPSLALHDEVAKLPWFSAEKKAPVSSAPIDAQISGVSGQIVSFRDIVRQLDEFLKATGTEGLRPDLAPSGASCQKSGVAARAGIEPATK